MQLMSTTRLSFVVWVMWFTFMSGLAQAQDPGPEQRSAQERLEEKRETRLALQEQAQRADSDTCQGAYNGVMIEPEELVLVLEKHELWLQDPTAPAGERANLCGADLREFEMPDINLRFANLQQADLSLADLQASNLSRANLRGASFLQADLTDANLTGAMLQTALMSEANLSHGSLIKANLTDANLDGTILEGAFLVDAILRNASFVRANLKESTLSGVDFSKANLNGAEMTSAIYEPKLGTVPNLTTMALARDLETMRFEASPHGLVELRGAFRAEGMRAQERQITYAIKKGERLQAGRLEASFNYILFEMTCLYGLDPGRSLIVLGVMIVIYALPYWIALLKANKRAGIWASFATDDGDKTFLIRPRLYRRPRKQSKCTGLVRCWRWLVYPLHHVVGPWGRIVRIGLYFSMLSAFRISWSGFDFGDWIKNLQRREYALSANGWVRTVSDIQALTSLYLWAMWLLAYFSRPFG